MSEAQSGRLTFQDGARAVELAREAVEAYVLNGQREHPGSMREAFYDRTGVFVRLEATGGRLRGCAGAHESSQQLGHGIVESAINAASEDSCRTEVEPAELGNLAISVCAVTNLVLTDDPEADLAVGVHGVALDSPDGNAWMYPTVPLDNGWNKYEYLDRTCRKAGLPKGAWEADDVMVTLFEGQVFRERTPGGEIEELTLNLP
ncbi:MAG: TIGR00296 family protein [Halobacteriaceae archaeon]